MDAPERTLSERIQSGEFLYETDHLADLVAALEQELHDEQVGLASVSEAAAGLERELARLREAIQIAEPLLYDEYTAHRDPDDANYNECEKDPCAWCVDVDQFRALTEGENDD